MHYFHPNCRRTSQGRRGGTPSSIHHPSAPLGVNRRGFFIFEMIVGLGLLALAAFVLVFSTSRIHVASSTLADSREATRAAEATLSQLQAGLTSPPHPADIQVRITPAGPASSGDSWQWVDVSATVRGQTRTLTGLVPRNAAQTAPAEGGGR